jgi:hypothetical protein
MTALAPVLLDARLKAGQDALDRLGVVMHGLDPCIPARWQRDKATMVKLISSPDLASWMPGSRPGKTGWITRPLATDIES